MSKSEISFELIFDFAPALEILDRAFCDAFKEADEELRRKLLSVLLCDMRNVVAKGER